MNMRGGGKKRWLYGFVIVVMLGTLHGEVNAEEAKVAFHGYFESNFVLRDTNGIQNGFFDHATGVQQRNTLKFDVDINPELKWETLSIEKVHLTFRGAYDSIFDLRAGHYSNIPDNRGLSRFDYGLEDIRFESDLREAFVDFVYKGNLGNAFFRPGRQIVSWGETTGLVLLDVINPADNSFQMFFQNPDDLKTPLWMARLNYTLPRLSLLGVNLDLLWVPDIRPTQFAPLDPSMEAPYTSFMFGGMKGLNVREEVPTEKQEYGAKMTIEIGERFSASAVYYRDVVNDPGLVLTNFAPTGLPAPFPPLAPTTVLFTHNTQNIFGGYFTYHILPIDTIARGEIAHFTAYPLTLPALEPDIVIGASGISARTFRLKPVTQWMLAFDKNILVPWLAPHQESNFSLQWVHRKINGWDSVLGHSEVEAKDRDIFLFTMNTFWLAGTLNPVLAAMYIPGGNGDGGGTGMISPSILWYITPRFYTKLSLQAFLGDKQAKSPFAGLIETSEASIKFGYEW